MTVSEVEFFHFLSTLREHGSLSSVGEVKDDLFIRSDIYQKLFKLAHSEEL